ncbi:hypothetical protein [Umezawaea sp. NPDC059074]|uniref:hypothetical protein n=1 Tax=Umezawaea sp. NPDC059074 TaxID=3346716 RepID=UPI00367585EC
MIAESNLGELSARVVIMRRDATGAVVPMCGVGEAGLADSSAVLVAPTSVSHEVLRAIQRSSVPDECAGNPWFDQHRALVFIEGCCVVDGHELHYDEGFGVYTVEGE